MTAQAPEVPDYTPAGSASEPVTLRLQDPLRLRLDAATGGRSWTVLAYEVWPEALTGPAMLQREVNELTAAALQQHGQALVDGAELVHVWTRQILGGAKHAVSWHLLALDPPQAVTDSVVLAAAEELGGVDASLWTSHH